jgi:hypothetical protein
VKIKRLLSIFLLLCSLAAVAQEPANVVIEINGEKLDNDPPAVMVKGRTMLPLRKVFNALGATVTFKDKVITAQRGDNVILLTPNNDHANLNGDEVILEVAPLLLNGTTYVPLDFVSTALGYTVAFDKASRTISVKEEDPIDVAPSRISILETRLKQLVVGNQGAILKVRNPDATEEVYYRGLDDRDTAPYDTEDHGGILQAVELHSELPTWVKDVIEAYEVLPKREAIAFLGLVYSIPDHAPIDPGAEVDDLVEEFLIKQVKENESVILRRQAVLSMAVGESGPVDPEILEAVLTIYETSENLWETFPVQQYFQYHAERLRALPNFPTIRARVAAVNSLYTANILGYLDGEG